MAAKKVDPIMQREQMATDIRKNKKKELKLRIFITLIIALI